MNDEQKTKLESGVAECLEQCSCTDRPFSTIGAFIETLKAAPHWTDAEIIELQTRVIRVLLYRTSGKQPAHDE